MVICREYKKTPFFRWVATVFAARRALYVFFDRGEGD